MEIRNLHGYLEDEFDYPVALSAVVRTVGDVEIDARGTGGTETIGAVLDPLDDHRFESAEELFHTTVGNLGDDYVGRKFYDDRGGNPTAVSSGPSTDVQQSF